MAIVDATLQPWLLDQQIYTWSPLTTTDTTGSTMAYVGSADRTVQVQGTFGVGGSVSLQGSLDQVNWFTLRDPQSVALTFTSPGLKAVLEGVHFIQPVVTAGDGTTSITVIVSAVRRQNV
jgi:hypothetical protein